MENKDSVTENKEQQEAVNLQETPAENATTDKETITKDIHAAEEQLLKAEKELQAKVNELNDKYLRLYAEYDNYRRRTAKESIELQAVAGKDIIVSMLGVLDDFDRASKSMETAKEIEAVKEGVKLIHHKLKNALTGRGLEEMKSVGEEFNSDIHEAITNIPAPSEEMKGKVVDEVEKGYYLNGKVIRFAKVVVGQ